MKIPCDSPKGFCVTCDCYNPCTKDCWLNGAYQKGRADAIKEYGERFLKTFCTDYCNQKACDGGMAGSIQECETIRLLKDACNDVGEQIKEKNK